MSEYEDEEEERKFNPLVYGTRIGFIILGILLIVLDVKPFSDRDPLFVVLGFSITGIIIGTIVDKTIGDRKVYEF